MCRLRQSTRAVSWWRLICVVFRTSWIVSKFPWKWIRGGENRGLMWKFTFSTILRLNAMSKQQSHENAKWKQPKKSDQFSDSFCEYFFWEESFTNAQQYTDIPAESGDFYIRYILMGWLLFFFRLSLQLSWKERQNTPHLITWYKCF